MKPLGRKYYKAGGKRDYHFRKKYFINWWEAVCTPNKTYEKRLVEKEIKDQLAS